jgi:hypothetical protein
MGPDLLVGVRSQATGPAPTGHIADDEGTIADPVFGAVVAMVAEANRLVIGRAEVGVLEERAAVGGD